MPDERPHPPGDYPIVVVGSGPGGIQTSYSLSRLGIRHAAISADPSPGGMFRRFPFFQRLLSWTKPHAPYERLSREYEWYDWNSLLGDEPAHRAVMPELMDGTSDFPSRPEMELGLTRFVERTATAIRYDCRWESTARDGERFVLRTSDGEYRCKVAIFAVGVAEPYKPDTPGFDLIPHYVDTRAAESYAGKRLFIIGKQNSGFELATGLLPWASRIVLASPRPATLSVNLYDLAGIRARYLQPWEDANLGNGVFILNASTERIEHGAHGFTVHTRGSVSGEPLAVEVDEVIAATGFQCPLGDLGSLGVTVFGQSRLPSMTAWFESATVPGIYFAGTIGQGVPGLRKFGHPANSGAVHGARYNARMMARQVARVHFGAQLDEPVVAPQDVVAYLLQEATVAPELWNQKSYLARALVRDDAGAIRDTGIVPLADFVDAPGPDGVALSIETNDRGDIYPICYVRRGGRVSGESPLDPQPMHDFRTNDHRRRMGEIVAPLLRAA
ncbi:MAG TPA: NAD(P)-binding domain-containing protein [Candidatus Limnocylindrales bacterium]|nr:NAD(P)-binding domain-containing protein [Candidatus Limnocylindrales bacterium]